MLRITAGRHALITYVVVAVLVTGLVRINVTLPWIGHLGSALVIVGTLVTSPPVSGSPVSTSTGDGVGDAVGVGVGLCSC